MGPQRNPERCDCPRIALFPGWSLSEDALCRRGCGSASGTATRRAGRRRSTLTRRRSCRSSPTPCAPRRAPPLPQYPLSTADLDILPNTQFHLVWVLGLLGSELPLRVRSAGCGRQNILRQGHRHCPGDRRLSIPLHAQVCLYTCGDLIANVPFFQDAEEGFTTSVVTLLRPAVSAIPLCLQFTCYGWAVPHAFTPALTHDCLTHIGVHPHRH